MATSPTVISPDDVQSDAPQQPAAGVISPDDVQQDAPQPSAAQPSGVIAAQDVQPDVTPSRPTTTEDLLTQVVGGGSPGEIATTAGKLAASGIGDVLSQKVGPEIPGTSKAWDIATGHRMPWEPPVGGRQAQPTQPARRPTVDFPIPQPFAQTPTTKPEPTPSATKGAQADKTPIWQAFGGDTGLNKLADHVIAMEGDSRVARQNNNPGNLKDPATGKFMKFGSYQDGRNALLRQLGHWRDQHPDWSIADFNRVYAPDESRGGDNPEGTENNRNQYLMNAIRLAGGVEAKTKD